MSVAERYNRPRRARPPARLLPRHAWPPILLGGWLLMYPPCTYEKPEQPQCHPEAPMAKSSSLLDVFRGQRRTWEHTTSYDTARECERARRSLIRKSMGTTAGDPKDPNNEIQTIVRSSYGVANCARCIPAEYIYPPKAAAPE